MRKQLISIALVGGLGLGSAALAVPGIASAADSTTTAATSRLGDRVTAIKDALKGLVTNGTITQSQADKVATTLAEKLPPPRDGHGRRHLLPPEAVAKALGISVDQLRSAHEAGQTLVQVAAAHGISKAELISRLVTAAKAQLAADVTAGRLTQAQADTIASGLKAHITEMVSRAGGPHDGRGPRPGDAPPPGDAPDTAAPA